VPHEVPIDWQLKRAIDRLEDATQQLLGARSHGNAASEKVKLLAELICIESRSASIAYFDAMDWGATGAEPTATTAFEQVIRRAAEATKGTAFYDRVQERLHDVEEYIRQA